MGKQVNFYMLPEDELLFLQMALKDPNIKLIPTSFPKPRPLTWDIHSLTDIPHTQLFFWDIHYPIKKYITAHTGKRYDTELAKLVSTGEKYFIISSEISAPLIEYSPSKLIDQKVLISGRIWAEMYGISDDKSALVYKGKEFEAWYDGLAKWLRRNLKRVPGVREYFGKNALSWFREGGRIGFSNSWITWDQLTNNSKNGS